MKKIYIILIIIIFFIGIFELSDIKDVKNKYNLSILAIFKNETMNLDIWLQHYIWQGVDHFYLINNGSTDNPLKILQKYIDSGIVTLYDLPQKHNQVGHYRHVYDAENLKETTKWLIMADIDEFWYCNKKNIKETLKDYESEYVIYSNWKMFGSDNLENHPDDIRTSIIHREEVLHSNTKWIIQTKYIDSYQINVHNISLKYPILLYLFFNISILISHIKSKNIYNTSNIFKLNHYPLQSKEFYVKVKMTRGDVASSDIDNIRNMKYFDNYNKNTTYEDTELKNLIFNGYN